MMNSFEKMDNLLGNLIFDKIQSAVGRNELIDESYIIPKIKDYIVKGTVELRPDNTYIVSIPKDQACVEPQSLAESIARELAVGPLEDRLFVVQIKQESGINRLKIAHQYLSPTEQKLFIAKAKALHMSVATSRDIERNSEHAFLTDMVSGEEYAIFDGDTVGRSDSCDICLDHPMISRIHAQFFVNSSENGDVGIEIIDLGSTHGIYINGVCLRPGIIARLNEHDLIVFADRKYELEMEG